MARFGVPIVACLTLGLAPLLPEQHIVAKLRCLAGGAIGGAVAQYFGQFCVVIAVTVEFPPETRS